MRSRLLNQLPLFQSSFSKMSTRARAAGVVFTFPRGAFATHDDRERWAPLISVRRDGPGHAAMIVAKASSCRAFVQAQLQKGDAMAIDMFTSMYGARATYRRSIRRRPSIPEVEAQHLYLQPLVTVYIANAVFRIIEAIILNIALHCKCGFNYEWCVSCG